MGRRANDGTHRGGGRPRLKTDYRARCRRIADDPENWKKAQAWALSDSDFFRWVCEQGYGRAPQSLDVTQTNVNLNVTVVAMLKDLSPDMLTAFVERGEWKALPEVADA